MATDRTTYVTFKYLILALLIGLKLSGSISWSWWWVLSPFWIPSAANVLLALLLAFIGHKLLR